ARWRSAGPSAAAGRRAPAAGPRPRRRTCPPAGGPRPAAAVPGHAAPAPAWTWRRRSEEHTSELQSRENLVCRLLLEKKNKICRIELAAVCLTKYFWVPVRQRIVHCSAKE